MPTLISGTPANLEELIAIGEKAIAEGKVDQNKGGNTVEEPKESKSKEVESKEVEEKPAIEAEEELKSFKFYDADTDRQYTIVEGIPKIISTEVWNTGGTWHIDYTPDIASFSLDYGYWTSWLNITPFKFYSFSNRKLVVKPNSRITSDEVKTGRIEEPMTPQSLTQTAFAGSKSAETITIVLIGGLILVLLLRR